MIWRNANGQLSIESLITIAFATFVGSIAGALWMNHYHDHGFSRTIVFESFSVDGDEWNPVPHAKQ